MELSEKPKKETRKESKKESVEFLGSDQERQKRFQDPGESLLDSENLDGITIPQRRSTSKIFITWNVAGMRSTVKNPLFLGFLSKLGPDVICLQETKLSDKGQVSEEVTQSLSDQYHDIWNHCTARKGYSGTAIFTREEPLSVLYGLQEEKHNEEGRVITLEYEKYFLVNAYVPNAGEGLRRLNYRIDSWEKDMCQYLCGLNQKKPVIYTGDLNVAHQEIDIYQPKGHEKHAGFTPQERQKFTDLLQCGFVDAFRYLYPHRQSFTYWSKRAKAKERNHGWRLDYFVTSERLVPCILECEMFENIYISDHCPLMLHLDIAQLK
ncbi:Exodeoxyribonuclease [Galdieria sulphuraria]|nr:Exodeoxyribonuclease [Galdieria sulphuraria]